VGFPGVTPVLDFVVMTANDPRPLADGRASKDLAMPPLTGVNRPSLRFSTNNRQAPRLAARIQDDPTVPAIAVVHYNVHA
jgi:hypothetical protein